MCWVYEENIVASCSLSIISSIKPHDVKAVKELQEQDQETSWVARTCLWEHNFHYNFHATMHIYLNFNCFTVSQWPEQSQVSKSTYVYMQMNPSRQHILKDWRSNYIKKHQGSPKPTHFDIELIKFTRGNLLLFFIWKTQCVLFEKDLYSKHCH